MWCTKIANRDPPEAGPLRNSYFSKGFQDPHQRQRVPPAVFQQRLFDPIAPGLIQAALNNLSQATPASKPLVTSIPS
jgi:hypothetical protein